MPILILILMMLVAQRLNCGGARVGRRRIKSDCAIICRGKPLIDFVEQVFILCILESVSFGDSFDRFFADFGLRV